MYSAQHRLLAAVGLTMLVALPSMAGGVLISPVVIELDSPRRAVAVRVTNGGDAPITLQTEAFSWKQVDGQDRDEPTEELLIVPPIVEVAAGSTQVFRVMLRAPVPAPAERSYHVVLEDITEAQTPKEGQAAVIAFKLSHRLPVMVAPTGKITTTLRWKPCMNDNTRSVNAEACVRLFNAGNRRIRVETLTVIGNGWKQSLPVKSGINMLAGTERDWRIPLSAGQAGALLGVQVQTGRSETLQAEAGGF